MGAILLMVFLEFADIGFPPEVSLVDSGDEEIHLVRGNVIMMRV